MSLDDQRTARLLRSAVEQTSDQHADAALADRLLAGVTRRRRTRRLSAVAGAATVVLVAAAAFVALPEGSDELVPATPGGSEGPPSVPLRAGAVTHEQAARAGLDGRPQCESGAVRGGAPTFGQETAPPAVMAGYLTDAAGFEAWMTEYNGSRSAYTDGVSPFGDGLVAVCWYEGDIPRDTSGGYGGPQNPRFRLLAVQLGDQPQMRLDSIGEKAIPILAPPLPDPALLSREQAAQGEVVHPQHPDVPVVDVLRDPPPPPPRDCFVDGCPGDGDVETRLEIVIDGEPHRHGEERTIAAGSVVPFEVTVQVEQGEQLSGFSIGLTPSARSISNLEEMEALVQPTGPLTGTQTFRFEWRTPPGPSDRILMARWEIQPAEAEQGTFVQTDLAVLSVR